MLLRLQGRGRAVLLEPVPVLRRALHLLPVRAGRNTQPGARTALPLAARRLALHADTSSSTLFEAAIAVTFAPTCEGAGRWHSHPHAKFYSPQRAQPSAAQESLLVFAVDTVANHAPAGAARCALRCRTQESA